MPAHHLTTGTETLSRAIEAVAAGGDLAQVARSTGVALTTLLSAIEIYQQAGRAALEDRSETEIWLQAHVEFAEWEHAEQITAASVLPAFDDLERSGLAARWWFIRKYPHWRFRVQASSAEVEAALRDELSRLWRELAGSGKLTSWQRTVYEPETLAFGGYVGMEHAHRLFSADSRVLLAYFSQEEPPLGRREVSILLCTRLFREANLDWFEIGDVWHRVATLRPFNSDNDEAQISKMAGDLRILLQLDTRVHGPLFQPSGVLPTLSEWASAFGTTGAALAEAAEVGTLERGLRSVLAQHIIFHWNRLGLNAKQQSIIARAAEAAVLHT